MQLDYNMAIPVILIFDVGKTNKKLFLFDKEYNILHEESTRFDEIKDEDGFPCEDLQALTKWIWEKFLQVSSNEQYNLRAVNFSAYGASLVYLDYAYKPRTPLYNYLKPYPEKLKQQFYNTYGGESLIAKQTASPVLGSLNSGMQLYRLNYEQPEIYNKIKCSLHLPQYLSFIISKKPASDITSIGCHTNLWHFEKNDYHEWVYKENFRKKFAPLYNSDNVIATIHNDIKIGIGLHDSSAALIPYLKSFHEPFILISTGTWNISLNPFNHTPLTDEELNQDCLCYLSYEGKPVKASRLFAGYEHEEQVKRLAAHFNRHVNYCTTIAFNNSILNKLQQTNNVKQVNNNTELVQSAFAQQLLNDFETYEEAYHRLMLDIITQQVFSTKLILNTAPIKKIFVDGGFSKNDVYMNLLAALFPDIKVYAANIAQASALGAALMLHSHLTKDEIISDIIELKHYANRIL